MPTPPDTETLDGLDIAALDAVTDAVESGAGLPEVVRAASRALDASLVLSDRAGATLAVAARSTADERALATGASGVEVLDLRVADQSVGTLLLRLRGTPDPMMPAVVRLITSLIAGEVERLRAPERASQEEAGRFLRDVLDGEVTDHGEIVERAAAPRVRRRDRGERARRASPSACHDRGRLAVPRARDSRARCARRGPRSDRGAERPA